MIGELIASDHAYSANGDVYFAVRTQPDYGFLSGQRIDESIHTERQPQTWQQFLEGPGDG